MEAQKVPSIEDIQKAGRKLADGMNELVEQQLITGSCIYGSTGLDLSSGLNPETSESYITRRSDIDIFIAISGENKPHRKAVREVIRSAASNDRELVCIDAIIMSEDDLSMGLHGLDRFFGYHLGGPGRVVAGEDPSKLVNYPETPAAEIISSYLANKNRRMSKAYNQLTIDSIKDGGLQRMFELPVAVARKAVQALREVRGEDINLASADKTAVHQAALQVMGQDSEILTGYKALAAMNNQYDLLLQQTLSAEIDSDQYEAALKHYHSKLPAAMTWLSRLGHYLLPKLEVDN